MTTRTLTTKHGRTWRRTIGGWVLATPEHGTWIARLDGQPGHQWWVLRQATRRFTARTLDEAADRIAQHAIPKGA